MLTETIKPKKADDTTIVQSNNHETSVNTAFDTIVDWV